MTADTDGKARRERGSDGRLRPAMFQDDEEPRFPAWLPLPGILLALAWAAYQGFTADGSAAAEVAARLVWPGVPIFLVTTVTAYFGWRLDLD